MLLVRVFNARLIHMEQQPRLAFDVLLADQRVPNDRLLRGASPQEVLGTLRARLEQIIPAKQNFTLLIAKTDEDRFKIQERWIKIAKRLGIPLERVSIGEYTRAAIFADDLYISPQVTQQLQGTIWERAEGAGTFCHEWWHLSRQEARPFFFFEEGSAEYFSVYALKQLTGVETSRAIAYQELYEGVSALVEYFSFQWLLATRNTPRIMSYLRTSFEAEGFDQRWINEVLSTRASEFIWRDNLRAMLRSR
jgi:hypothetical protein